jgi:hypothetical protein
MSVVGLLTDETDPMVSVMKVRGRGQGLGCGERAGREGEGWRRERWAGRGSCAPPWTGSPAARPKEEAHAHAAHSLASVKPSTRLTIGPVCDSPPPFYGPSFSSPSSSRRSCPSLRSPLQVEKAPLESYADVGGLEAQIQEIKEAVELPLTHPELYEDIGIKPPKVGALRRGRERGGRGL